MKPSSFAERLFCIDHSHPKQMCPITQAGVLSLPDSRWGWAQGRP